ncbi:MAG: T9SS type A sorting domain-containing protein, partial [Bacteroidetes bacterium]|nr:T9SS type A sorting domain-containing protein [Bacteroidota bacterium]
YSPEVEATIEVVGTHQLSNAYPNPFNPQSQFNLAVARDQRVTAELYNVLGQRVATLFNGTIEANSTQIVRIDGGALASGAYIVRIAGETFTDALRVTLTK